MLSRSNSNAADRLRRAKSTSSSHTSASGHQRHTAAVDPFVSRQQAEAAAVEAYERARLNDEPTSRPVPPKLQRRRSQAAGKSEGSHFEQARRRSMVRAEEASKSRSVQPPRSSASLIRQNDDGEERIITRRRSVIPPTVPCRQSQIERSSSISTAGRHARQRASEFSDGSPMPRYSQTVHERQSTPVAEIHPTDGYDGNLDHLSNFSQSKDVSLYTSQAEAPPQLDLPRDETALAQARDKCLQDFQTKRVRERRSFILAPFQKRRATVADSNFDVSLPPVNYADNGDAAPIPPNPPIAIPGIVTDRKTRNISASLKGRFMKVFRRTSKAPAVIPPQHVTGKDFHFTLKDYDISETDDSGDANDPFMTIALENPRPGPIHYDSTNSKTSSGQQSDGKSRVTSWTASTVAGVSTIRSNDGPTNAGVKPNDSSRTLRKASSFFGRPIQNKLRRSSKADLKGSEESQGLYSALQKRIRPSKSMECSTQPTGTMYQDTAISRTGSALETLPSQKYYNASVRSGVSSTIRPVTPVEAAYVALDVPSPVQEVMSPEGDGGADETVIHHECESSDNTPQNGLKRRSAIKAPPPTAEQLTRRMERSKNRWKSPLDELSPPVPRSTRGTIVDDNPYELRSLNQHTDQVVPPSYLPYHARVKGGSHAARADALSPSVYSRATDGESPRSPTPEDVGMTTITVTAREVRKYDFSPSKLSNNGQRNQNSREWRRWLSDEMGPFGGGEKVFELPDNDLPNTTAQKIDETAGQAGKATRSTRRDSRLSHTSSPGSASGVGDGDVERVQLSRSRPTSSASSRMNDRYPIINASRNSSRRSVVTARRTSRHGSIEHPALCALPSSSKQSVEDSRNAIIDAKAAERVEDVDTTEDQDADRLHSVIETYHVKEQAQINNQDEAAEERPTPAVPFKAPARRTADRPKSAYELRVHYKNGASSRSRPLEVRRKPLVENSMLEDSTIVNISAGPYATQRPASVNRENTPPLDSPLPALSSSEWLAMGAKKKKEARKASSMNPLGRAGGQRSPGQRLVTNWLDERRSKENTPAFV